MGDIWCVSSGSYSDYGVHCCFTTEEAAQAYAAEINGRGRIAGVPSYDEFEVERFDLDPPLPSSVKQALDSAKTEA
jgi:hypothetical protein